MYRRRAAGATNQRGFSSVVFVGAFEAGKADQAAVQAADRPEPERRLDAKERSRILEVLHSERFVDQAPAEVYATLLDEGVYLCSVRTMYRLLQAHQEVKERRRIRRHVKYEPPELLAERPKQVWSWDITRLLGPEKWQYYSLYVVMDIFSRYVVGWMVAPKESASLAEHLIQEACLRQGIGRGQLTIHADRGASMTSRTVAQLLLELGVAKTHSRPYCSNDNPYSESQFKTLKYRPEFPRRFFTQQEAEAFCQTFFLWYNQRHHHSGIGYLTPEMVHFERTEAVLEARRTVLSAAYREHPERFVHNPPEPKAPPEAVWINPPAKKPQASSSREAPEASYQSSDQAK